MSKAGSGLYVQIRNRSDFIMNGNAQRIVATVMLAMLGWIIADQRSLRGEIRSLDEHMTRLEVTLSERIARLEGRVDTLVDVFTNRED